MSVLDASVIVSWFVESDTNFSVANRWLSQSQAAGDTWNVPSIALTEVAASLGRLTQDPRESFLAVVRFARLRQVSVFPVSVALAMAAANIGAELQIRGCDAIYVALASELNDVLVTFDRQQLDRAQAAVVVLQPD